MNTKSSKDQLISSLLEQKYQAEVTAKQCLGKCGGDPGDYGPPPPCNPQPGACGGCY